MIRLAWRNLWRNRRRTLITISSLAFGLAAIMFGQSMIKTIQYQLIEKATGVIAGHLQVVNLAVSHYEFPEKLIDDPAYIESTLSKIPNLGTYEARLRITGLISSKAESLAVLVVGVQPDRDTHVTTMHTYMSVGRYLTGRPNEIVIGNVLAKKLRTKVGEKLVVMAQAADGSIGADNYTVVGIFCSNSETFDGGITYVPIKSLQSMLAMEGKVTDFVIRLREPERLEDFRGRVISMLKIATVKVVTWEEFTPELVGVRDYQNAILAIMLTIVFVIVALGILNTLLMSTLERVREFGVLMAIGAKSGWILRLVITESFLLGIVGGAAGLALGSALIVHFHRVGLDIPMHEAIGYFIPFDTHLLLRFNWQSHRTALLSVVITCIAASVPPAWRASRLLPANAIRQI